MEEPRENLGSVGEPRQWLNVLYLQQRSNDFLIIPGVEDEIEQFIEADIILARRFVRIAGAGPGRIPSELAALTAPRGLRFKLSSLTVSS